MSLSRHDFQLPCERPRCDARCNDDSAMAMADNCDDIRCARLNEGGTPSRVIPPSPDSPFDRCYF